MSALDAAWLLTSGTAFDVAGTAPPPRDHAAWYLAAVLVAAAALFLACA